MMRFFWVVFALSLFPFLSLHAADPVVLVQHNGQYQGYFSQPRLSDVVTSINQNKDLYWPAASFYILDENETAQLEQRKQSVLNRLSDLKSYFESDGARELANSVVKLEADLSSARLAKKLFLPLDPDRVRAKKSLNPLIDPGSYLLTVVGRPEYVSLAGLVRQQEIPLLNASPLTAYVDELTMLAGASSSFVYLLPADSAPFIASTGLWNSVYQAVPPGSMLFFPFEKRLLPEQFKDINEQVVELLVHKVVMQ